MDAAVASVWEVAARIQAGPAGRGGEREEADMRLTVRDVLATLFVAAAAVLYGTWVTGAALTGLSTRVIAVVVFGLGWAACVTDQKEMAVVFGADRTSPRPPAAYAVITSAAGALVLVTGIITLVTASATALAMLVASTAALWLIATARHTLASSAHRTPDGSGPAARIV